MRSMVEGFGAAACPSTALRAVPLPEQSSGRISRCSPINHPLAPVAEVSVGFHVRQMPPAAPAFVVFGPANKNAFNFIGIRPFKAADNTDFGHVYVGKFRTDLFIADHGPKLNFRLEARSNDLVSTQWFNCFRHHLTNGSNVIPLDEEFVIPAKAGIPLFFRRVQGSGTSAFAEVTNEG
jgi:hypothetical protein